MNLDVVSKFNNFLIMRWFQILETQYPHEVVSIIVKIQ